VEIEMNRKIKITILHKIALTYDSIAPASEIVYGKPGGHLLGGVDTFIDEAPEPVLDLVNLILDIGGLFPFGGEPLDVASGLIYMDRGLPLWAAMSGISVIPVAGDAVGKGFKYLYKSIEAVKTLGTMSTISNALETILDAFLAIQAAVAIHRVKINKKLAYLSELGGRPSNYLIEALDAGMLDMKNKINSLV
jgi:hypothetical protein